MARVNCCYKILDNFHYFGNDWSRDTKIKIKDWVLNIFLNKKILIYGLGISGLSTYKFLKNKNDIFLYDDNKLKIKTLGTKENLISYKEIFKTKFKEWWTTLIQCGLKLSPLTCQLLKLINDIDTELHDGKHVIYTAAAAAKYPCTHINHS